MSREDAIRRLREDPDKADLIRDLYFDADLEEAARRYGRSAEFGQIRALLGDAVAGATILDVGAGAGLASRAFVEAGAARVLAIEPSLSAEVGCRAARVVGADLPVSIVAAAGEAIPLTDASVDLVFAREALHHARHLGDLLGECHRVLAPGGRLLACREHVVDDEADRRSFLENHLLHNLTGDEWAYSLEAYVTAIQGAGFSIDRILGPWDSVINCFPVCRTQKALERLAAERLSHSLGELGRRIGALPWVRTVHRWWLDRPFPGRMYSFLTTG